MCGLNGIYNFSGKALGNVAALIDEMNGCIVHRGPDDNGTWFNETQGVYFGHQRLSIIDLSEGGHQPMLNDSGSAIVFNGEIYNYRELPSLLPGYKFKTASDTEILMELYQRKGHDALPHLNGMFAFAFWDQQQELLMLARDRSGKKPLYYSIANGVFAFSSEIKALLKLPWIKPETDDEALYHFLTFNQVSAPNTLFKSIHKLLPGYKLTINKRGKVEQEQYWDVEYQDFSKKPEKQIADELYHELEKSVAYRMVADVPVGAFLSGGVDSSAVVALMHQQGHSKIKTYSIGFEDQPGYDELAYAKKISVRYDTEHYEKIITPEDLREFIPRIADIFDDPLADATAIPIYFISQIARETGSKVVQTGDGSDELFMGYRNWMRYAKLYPLYHVYNNFPLTLKKSIAAVTREGSARSEIFERAAKGEEFFWGGAKAFKEGTKKSFLNADWLNSLQGINSYSVIEKVKQQFDNHKKLHPHLNDVDWMCYLGFKQQVPYRYLYRMDKLGMANSIEIRSPFLDYNLVNYALSIPSFLKIKNNEPKYILKKSLERLLDNDTLYRKKMGFCVPLREWADKVMIDHVNANLEDFCRNVPIFNKEGLLQLIVEIKNGKAQYTNQLWTVYFLMAWYERWIY